MKYFSREIKTIDLSEFLLYERNVYGLNYDKLQI